MQVAIVIPAFNEEDTIIQVVNDIKNYGKPIVVDDCSTDGTYARCLSENISVIHHSVNLGYDAALQSGFEHAFRLGVDIIITMDADGQHTSKELEKILYPLLNNKAEMVLGVRSNGFARISERVFSAYTQLRFGVNDILCGIKGYKIDLYLMHGCFDSIKSIGTELALASLRRGVNFQQVEVLMYPRIKGKARFGGWLSSNLHIFRAFLFAVWADIRNSRDFNE